MTSGARQSEERKIWKSVCAGFFQCKNRRADQNPFRGVQNLPRRPNSVLGSAKIAAQTKIHSGKRKNRRRDGFVTFQLKKRTATASGCSVG